MGNNKSKDQNQKGNAAEDNNKAGRNWDPNKKMDIDPNLGGPFAYSENQENESIHTIPDDNLNPASRGVEELMNRDEEDKNKPGNKE